MVKWWLLPIVGTLGVLIGVALYHFVYFASTNELVRQLTARVSDLERTGRELEGTITVLRGQLIESQKLIDGATRDNTKLADDLRRANEKAQRIVAEIQRSSEILSDLGRTTGEITDTIGRIEELIREVEQLCNDIRGDS